MNNKKAAKKQSQAFIIPRKRRDVPYLYYQMVKLVLVFYESVLSP